MPQEKKDCVFCNIVGDVVDGFFNALEKFQVLRGELTALKDDDRMAEAAAKIRLAGGI